MAGRHTIRIRKTIELCAGIARPGRLLRSRRPAARRCLHFAVEINLAAMAGHAPDRYYTDPPATRLGMLDARLDLPHTSGLTLTDEWLDLSVGLSWSQPAGLWCFPIRDRQPERRRLRRGLPVVGRHPPLARHRRRHGRWEVRIR